MGRITRVADLLIDKIECGIWVCCSSANCKFGSGAQYGPQNYELFATAGLFSEGVRLRMA